MGSARVAVAAKALIRGEDDRILMIENPDVGWEIPGGKMEEDEDLLKCLHREVFEETGTQISDCRLAGIYSNLSGNGVVFAFVSKYVSGSVTTSPESTKVEWVKPDECLGRVSHPVIRDRIRDMISIKEGILYRAYTTGPYQILKEDCI